MNLADLSPDVIALLDALAYRLRPRGPTRLEDAARHWSASETTFAFLNASQSLIKGPSNYRYGWLFSPIASGVAFLVTTERVTTNSGWIITSASNNPPITFDQVGVWVQRAFYATGNGGAGTGWGCEIFYFGDKEPPDEGSE